MGFSCSKVECQLLSWVVDELVWPSVVFIDMPEPAKSAPAPKKGSKKAVTKK